MRYGPVAALHALALTSAWPAFLAYKHRPHTYCTFEWELTDAPTTNITWNFASLSADASKLYAVAVNGSTSAVWTSTSAHPTKWTRLSNSPDGGGFPYVQSDASGKKLILSAPADIFTSKDGGQSWSRVSGKPGTGLPHGVVPSPSFNVSCNDSTPTILDISSVYNNIPFYEGASISADGKVMVASDGVTSLYRSHDSGKNWKIVNTISQGFSTAWVSGDGSFILAVSNGNYNPNGEVYTSVDGGLHFRRIVPDPRVYFTVASSSFDGKYVLTGGLAAATGPIVSEDSVNTYFNGSSVGNLYVSSDYGKTFETVTNANQQRLWVNGAASYNGKRMYAVDATNFTTGNVWYSTDYGEHWHVDSHAPAQPWFAVATDTSGLTVVAGAYDGGGLWVGHCKCGHGSKLDRDTGSCY